MSNLGNFIILYFYSVLKSDDVSLHNNNKLGHLCVASKCDNSLLYLRNCASYVSNISAFVNEFVECMVKF